MLLGVYLILHIDETISNDGYIQTMKLLKNPNSLSSYSKNINTGTSNTNNQPKPTQSYEQPVVTYGPTIQDLTPKDTSTQIPTYREEMLNNEKAKTQEVLTTMTLYNPNSSGGGGGTSF